MLLRVSKKQIVPKPGKISLWHWNSRLFIHWRTSIQWETTALKGNKMLHTVPRACLPDEAFNQVAPEPCVFSVCRVGGQGNWFRRSHLAQGLIFSTRLKIPKVLLQAIEGYFQDQEVCSAFSKNSGQKGVYYLTLFLNFRTFGQYFLLIIQSALVFSP